MAKDDWKNPSLTERQHMMIYSFGAASPSYWEYVAWIQANRIRQWQHELAGYVDDALKNNTPIPRAHGEDARISIPHLVGIDAHLLVYAADHAVRICERYRSLTNNDPDICSALSKFSRSASGVGDLRDMLAHIDQYAVGTGRKAREIQHDGPHAEFDGVDPDSEVVLRYGTEKVAVFGLLDSLRELVATVRPIIDRLVFNTDNSSPGPGD